MGLGDYQFILFPTGNQHELTEDGMEFVGPNRFDFAQAVEILEKLDYIKNDPSSKSWNSFDDSCYYHYYDGKFKIEIVLNSGTEAASAEEISIRTNFYKDEGNINETLCICKVLCDSLNLRCWGMKLRKIIDLNDGQKVLEIINHFNSFRNKD